jgi:hypothetical protein
MLYSERFLNGLAQKSTRLNFRPFISARTSQRIYIMFRTLLIVTFFLFSFSNSHAQTFCLEQNKDIAPFNEKIGKITKVTSEELKNGSTLFVWIYHIDDNDAQTSWSELPSGVSVEVGDLFFYTKSGNKKLEEIYGHTRYVPIILNGKCQILQTDSSTDLSGVELAGFKK